MCEQQFLLHTTTSWFKGDMSDLVGTYGDLDFIFDVTLEYEASIQNLF